MWRLIQTWFQNDVFKTRGGRGEFKHMFYAQAVRSLLIWWVLNPIFLQSRFSECGTNSGQFALCEYALGWIPLSSPSGCGLFPEGLEALSWPKSPRVFQVEGSHSSVPRGDMWNPPLTCPVCNIHVPTASRPRHRGLAWLQIQRTFGWVLRPPEVHADCQPCPPLPWSGRASSWSPSSKQQWERLLARLLGAAMLSLHPHGGRHSSEETSVPGAGGCCSVRRSRGLPSTLGVLIRVYPPWGIDLRVWGRFSDLNRN